MLVGMFDLAFYRGSSIFVTVSSPFRSWLFSRFSLLSSTQYSSYSVLFGLRNTDIEGGAKTDINSDIDTKQLVQASRATSTSATTVLSFKTCSTISRSNYSNYF